MVLTLSEAFNFLYSPLQSQVNHRILWCSWANTTLKHPLHTSCVKTSRDAKTWKVSPVLNGRPSEVPHLCLSNPWAHPFFLQFLSNLARKPSAAQPWVSCRLNMMNKHHQTSLNHTCSPIFFHVVSLFFRYDNCMNCLHLVNLPAESFWGAHLCLRTFLHQAHLEIPLAPQLPDRGTPIWECRCFSGHKTNDLKHSG